MTSKNESIELKCSDLSCSMPPWIDGFDSQYCLGHQPVTLPDILVVDGDLLEVQDAAQVVCCWECGAAGKGLALFDGPMMAGEVYCESCWKELAEKIKLEIRIGLDGYNF